MDEPRDPQPAADSRPRLVAAHTDLTPPKEAWAAYARHALACHACRDVDGGACSTAAELRKAWMAATDGAFRRLAGETA